MFNELVKNIDENQYYKENKYDESKEKVSVHLRISPSIANDITKIIAVYRDFNVDKYELTKSDFVAMVLKLFIDDLDDDKSAIYDLIGKMNDYRNL